MSERTEEGRKPDLLRLYIDPIISEFRQDRVAE